MSAAFAYREMRECFSDLRDRSTNPANRNTLNRLVEAYALLIAADETRWDVRLPSPSVVTLSQVDRERGIEALRGISDNLEAHSRGFLITRRDHDREDS